MLVQFEKMVVLAVLLAWILMPVVRADAPASSLVFQTVGGTAQKANPSVIRYDFGTTTQLDDKYALHGIEHTFVLTNSTSQPVTIRELKPSDICIDKDYVTDERHTQTLQNDINTGEVFPDTLDLPIKVAPGAQVKVFVSIDPMDVFPGPVLQSVDVMIQGLTQPAATLQMSGILQSGISFSSPVLDFGQIPAGKGAILPLSITLDRRLHRSLPNSILDLLHKGSILSACFMLS